MDPNLELFYREGSKVSSVMAGKGAKPVGETPSVVLCNPKYPHNVGGALRACANFEVGQLWYTGNRVPMTTEDKNWRLPREERMREYQDVKLFQHDYPFDHFPHGVPVAIELLDSSMPLVEFEHPKNAVYVFGPEDGSIPKSLRSFCHYFVYIPTTACLNLSAAVNVILYDRLLKSQLM